MPLRAFTHRDWRGTPASPPQPSRLRPVTYDHRLRRQ